MITTIIKNVVRTLHLAALILACGLGSVPAASQTGPDLLRLNQVGFYPDAPKIAIVVDAPHDQFLVRSISDRDTVLTGVLGAPEVWSASGETVRVADFSAIASPGRYEVVVPDHASSHPFEIRSNIHEGVARASLKAFYFQRASIGLRPAFAGVYSRPAGHPDVEVLVHASAATPERPAGSTISAPRGWYDAGDYNKYVVNSGISTSTLLSFLEHYPRYAAALETDIPESGDGVPDLLDEVLWNLRWMLAMQDPHDGGVYHKLTHADFSGVVMPHQATAPRYVVEKSTAATLDLAAVMAQAARLLRDYESAFPGLADSTLSAAVDAWNWARRHPESYYNQSLLNTFYDPNIQTGEYGDGNVADEFDWAAMELYITTGRDSFLTAVNALSNKGFSLPAWPNVRSLGYYSLLAGDADGGNVDAMAAIRNRVIFAAEALRSRWNESPYRITMGAGDFFWGSNSGAANQGILLLQAYRETGNASFLDAATSVLDYLLGRNATGYSFVTGYGSRTPMYPHHRPSQADAVTAPVPGLLVGGPNAGRQDGCSYPSLLPAQSYVDSWCSYASNEIAINWNAPLFYLAAAVEAERSATGMPVGAALPPDAFSDDQASFYSIYPNPSSGVAFVRLHIDEPTPVTIDVHDVRGRRMMLLIDDVLMAGTNELRIPSESLPSGVYFVRVAMNNGRATRPLILIR